MGAAGTITVNGGNVTANGNNSAGIGCGNSGTGGTINIKGGNVSAFGSDDIGSSCPGIVGATTISGGGVTVTGGVNNPGIEGATTISGGNVTIHGGARGEYASVFPAGIYGDATLSWTSESDSIEITRCTGTVTFSSDFLLEGTNTLAKADNIDGKKLVPCTQTVYAVTFDSNGGSDVPEQRMLDGGTVTEPNVPMRQGYAFGGWYSDEELQNPYDFSMQVHGNTTLYAKWDTPAAISYVDANGNLVSDFTSYTPLESSYTDLPAGVYYVGEDMRVGQITVNGEVSLILGCGKTLTAPSGILVESGNTLNVYADGAGTGTLVAKGSWGAAGIGGSSSDAGTINLFGGQIEAKAEGEYSTGIGAGYGSSEGTILLGCTHAADYIQSDSYSGSVTVRGAGARQE